ncbi:putative histone acetyltransferase chromatin regulator PHD family [Medicago truncatula]|uniref:Putative histone acetyltransferase chromatin regulator PHD family n=1 Tax=Medicago truncatula TaxID=3880 RepID=A0A396I9R0_MEDTR|nr:putative histone acetyltransferase chromatin regulator PHD family [Medicago truncatula]
MTNVSDAEQFVIKYKVRTGHKREFAFALNSHSEIGISLSKTRPRKNQNMVPTPKPKKTRMSSSQEELNDNVVEEIFTKNGDDDKKKLKNKKVNKKNKKAPTRGKKPEFCVNCRDVNVVSGLVYSSCEESKNSQPGPRHTTQTSNSHVSPTTANYRSRKPIVPQSSSYKGMKCITYCDKSPQRLTRKDQCLHKLVFHESVLKDGAAVGYFVDGEKQLHGEININKFGILCDCCNKVVSPSKFEAHAGWASRRKPSYLLMPRRILVWCFGNQRLFSYCSYSHIRTSNGVSLHELAINRRNSMSDSDEHCSSCQQRGDLLCCDGCQRSFYLDCIDLKSQSNSKWYCKYWRNKFQKDKNVEHKANDVPTGRIAEGGPSKQIVEISTLSVKQKVVEDSSCALCSKQDFNNNEFGPWTVMICDQVLVHVNHCFSCLIHKFVSILISINVLIKLLFYMFLQCEKGYHVECLKDHNMANLEKVPEGNWFCNVDCDDIHMKLKSFMARGDSLLSDYLLNLIKKKQEKKGFETELGLDIKWKIFNTKLIDSGIITSSFLFNVAAIFHEQFDSIVDTGTDIDLIQAMLRGTEIDDKYYFGGMYCAVLIVNQVVVSAGIFRVFGKDVAELPLVATKAEYKEQGFFRSLFSCIEDVLIQLKVKWLILPAAHEAKSMWKKKFGFTTPKQELMNDFRKFYHNLMIFEGTSLLQKKLVPPSQ